MGKSLPSKPLTLLEWKVLRYMARPYALGAETSAYYPCALVTGRKVLTILFTQRGRVRNYSLTGGTHVDHAGMF